MCESAGKHASRCIARENLQAKLAGSVCTAAQGNMQAAA